MTICLDLSAAAHERAGLGRYAASLAGALLELEPTLTAFINDPRESSLPPPLNALPTYTARLPRKRWRLRAAVSYFGGPTIDHAFPGVTLFHATEHLLPKLSRARSVFTLHDIAYLLFPQYHLLQNRIYLALMMPRFLARADRIIAVSENTRRDALRFYRLDPAKIDMIPEGVEPHFRPETNPDRLVALRTRYALPARFLLYIGTIEPRKNLPTLLEAYRTLRDWGCEFRLVIVGKKGWLCKGFFHRLRELGLEGEVIFPGYIPDDDLPALYSAAEAFVFPSLYEGFGLPPLEAMACGTPVVCSNASSLPEVVGDAGLLVAPDDVSGLAAAVERVLADPSLRAELSARGRERAARFTWHETARRTLEVYQGLSREHWD
jgi:glycosyltransferase involved in cell wall biosynthesis